MLMDAAKVKLYNEIKRSIQNRMPKEDNRYLNDRARTLKMVSKYKALEVRSGPPTRRSDKNRIIDCISVLDGFSFHQRATHVGGKPVAGTRGEIKDNITSWLCKRSGHRST